MHNGPLGAAMRAQAQGQPMAMQIAAPINDVQLVAMMATLLDGTNEERVTQAMDIVAESQAQMGENLCNMVALIKQKIEAKRLLKT